MNWNLFSMYIALALLGVGMVIYAKIEDRKKTMLLVTKKTKETTSISASLSIPKQDVPTNSVYIVPTGKD